MTENTLCFLDYESTGVSTRADRPTQFACIRTDMDLNEVDEPVMIYCKPSEDHLPHPEACLITGITPQVCLEKGLSEHEFSKVIETQLSKPGTIAMGFNTMSYDHELTRFMFWRNLIPAYDHEWRNDCARWDLIDVVRCCYALRPDGIKWPQRDGRTSLKLELLSAENGLLHEAAHDALSDVRATIAMAKLIKQEQPKLWNFCLKLRKKDAVIEQVSTGKPFIHISMSYGIEKGCMGIVGAMATHPTNKNEIIVWDLASDPRELKGMNAQQIRDRMFVKTADLPEGVTRLPIRTIAINKAPVVCSHLSMINDVVAERWSIDMDVIHQNAAHLESMLKELSQVVAEVFFRQDNEEKVDVEEDLYSGFMNNQDAASLRRIRSLDPATLIDRNHNFNDDRLSELVFRWRAKNFPDHISPEELERWHAICRDRLTNGGKNRLSLALFYASIDESEARLKNLTGVATNDTAVWLSETEINKNMKILADLREYGQGIEALLE